MSTLGEFARWFSKRLITGIVLMGIGLAAWNWKHQGADNGAHAAIHEQPETAKAKPQDYQSGSQRGLAPPSHPPVMGNDGWPAGIRQLSRQDQRKMVHR